MALKYCGTAVMLRYCSTRSVKKVKPGWDPALFNPAQSLPTDSALNCRRRRVSDERDHPKRNGVHNLGHHDSPEESDRACTVMPTTGRCSLASCPTPTRTSSWSASHQLLVRCNCVNARWLSSSLETDRWHSRLDRTEGSAHRRVPAHRAHWAAPARDLRSGRRRPVVLPPSAGRPRSFRERTVRLLDTALRNRSCANARDAGRGRVWRPSSGPNGVPYLL